MHCHYCGEYIDVNNTIFGIFGPFCYGHDLYVSHFCCIKCCVTGEDRSFYFKLQEQQKE